MKAVSAFAGTGSWEAPAIERGWDVLSFDNDERFEVTEHVDARDLTFEWFVERGFERPDVLWASFPCTSLSMGSNKHHWKASGPCKNCGHATYRGPYERWYHEDILVECDKPFVRKKDVILRPKSEVGELGLALIRKTLWMIEVLRPTYFILENPTALARKMPELQHLELRATSYCRWGMHYRKPTDLWGGFPEGFEVHPPCNTCNGQIVMHRGKEYVVDKDTGLPCHEYAPRGSRNGTQGLSAVDAGRIPRQLAEAFVEACEVSLGVASLAPSSI